MVHRDHTDLEAAHRDHTDLEAVRRGHTDLEAVSRKALWAVHRMSREAEKRDKVLPDQRDRMVVLGSVAWWARVITTAESAMAFAPIGWAGPDQEEELVRPPVPRERRHRQSDW